MIGEDPEADRERFPFVTESGIVVVPKGTLVPAKGPCVLANDVAELLGNEPELAAQLQARHVRRVGAEPPQLRLGRPALQEVRRRREPARSARRCASFTSPARSRRSPRSGGLADVVAGLPRRAGRRARHRCRRSLVPLYRGVAAAARRRRASRSTHGDAARRRRSAPHAIAVRAAHRARRPRHATASSTAPPLYDRAGRSTGPAAPATVGDNHLRFGVARQGRGRSRARRLVGGAARRPPRPRLAGRRRRDLRARSRSTPSRDRHDDPQPRLPRHLPEGT